MKNPIRVVAFVDGFNLYHAIKDLRQPHLRWLDIRRMCRVFAPSPTYELSKVYYFSAYATWLTDESARHREYVRALRASGVLPVLGKFKDKDRHCNKCNNRWNDHEEKETDVNIALYLYRGAVLDEYDRALLVSGDSDLVPAVRFVKTHFAAKAIRIIAPVGRRNSAELMHVAGGPSTGKKLQLSHIENCLLPEQVATADGRIVAVRPKKYEPPTIVPSPPIAPVPPA